MRALGLNFRPARVRAMSSGLFDPATLNLNLWQDASDSTAGAYLGRASAGQSGNRRLFLDTAYSTVVPGIATVGGKSVVKHSTAASPMAVATNAAPTTRLTLDDVCGAGSYSFSFVMTIDVAGPNTGAPEYEGTPMIGCAVPLAGGGAPGIHVYSTSQPGICFGDQVQNGYRNVTAKNVSVGTLVEVQGYYDAAAETFGFRLGQGAWTTLVNAGGGNPGGMRTAPIWIAGRQYSAAVWSGMAWGELLVGPGVWSTTATTGTFDQLAIRANSIWGTSL